MRTLHLPQLSTGEVAAESNMIVHRFLARALQRVEPGHAYLMLRDGDEGAVQQPHLTPFYEEDRRIRSFYAQQGYADLHRLVDLFGWQLGQYPTDVVFTSRVSIAPLLSIAMGAHPIMPMPVVLYEPRVVGPTDERRHNDDGPLHLAMRAAAYGVCIGLYMSEAYRDEAWRAARYFLSAGMLDRWHEHTFVIPQSVETPEPKPEWLKEKAESRTKRVLFAGRMNTNKRWEDLLDVFASVYQSRDDVEPWLHSPTGAFDKLDPRYHRWHRTTERLSREEYWRLCYTTHVGAYMSYDEGPNAVVQELILAGVAMALPDRPWVHRLFEPLRYPFIAKGPKEMKALLDWLLDNQEEAYTRLGPVRDMIRRAHSWEQTDAAVAKLVEYLHQWKRPDPWRAFRKIAMGMAGENGIRFGQVRQAMTRDGRTQAQAVQSAYAMYRAVADLDDLLDGDPWLRRAVE